MYHNVPIFLGSSYGLTRKKLVFYISSVKKRFTSTNTSYKGNRDFRTVHVYIQEKYGASGDATDSSNVEIYLVRAPKNRMLHVKDGISGGVVKNLECWMKRQPLGIHKLEN